MTRSASGTATGPLVGCYPGSFDPLTVAHLAIADAAVAQLDLDRLDLALSAGVALGKDSHHSPLDERVALIEEVAAASGRPWLRAVVTEHHLLVDIAAGYDVLVLGADKWAQVLDVAFYDSVEHRDDALRRLPPVACAPRRGHPVPAGVTVLDVPAWVGEVSSTAVRQGATHWHAGAQTRRSPE